MSIRAVRRAFALATAVAFTSSASGQGPPREPTIMVVEFPRGAKFIGFPRICPGETEESREEDLCMAELYEGWAATVRHVSGPRLARRSRIRLTAHAKPWPPGTRLLVAVLPFSDKGITGQFAYWWDWPVEDDDYCQAIDDLRTWPDSEIRQAFERGFRRRFHPEGYAEKADFRCLRG